jgi:hypothetical protein
MIQQNLDDLAVRLTGAEQQAPPAARSWKK